MASRSIHRWTCVLAACATLACGRGPAFAAQAHSSPEDRQRFVAVTRSLERAPLQDSLKADRAWAMAWLIDVPDIAVTVCDDPIGGVIHSKYRYGPEILTQDILAMATLIIEHPEMANDREAQQLAGVEGALNVYRAILRDKPNTKSAALDTMLGVQARGELREFVRKALISCAAKKK